VIKAVNRFKGN